MFGVLLRQTLTICGGPVWSTPAAQRAPCSTCRTYVQKKYGNLGSQPPKLTTLMVHIYTYSSTYWQLPLRMNTHIRRLYDIRIQPFIMMGCTLQKRRMRAPPEAAPLKMKLPKKDVAYGLSKKKPQSGFTPGANKRSCVTGKKMTE